MIQKNKFDKLTKVLFASTLSLTLTAPLHAMETETGETADPEEQVEQDAVSESGSFSHDAIEQPKEETEEEGALDASSGTSDDLDGHTVHGIPIDEQHFPDIVFRSFVMRFDADGNGVLDDQERGAVRSIHIRDHGLVSLAGIEHFGELRDLNIYSKALSSLDVSSNRKLETITSHFNTGLKSVTLGSLPALRSLDLFGTAISTLDVSGAPLLEMLQCTSTPLTALDVSNNPSLKTLRCANTYIGSLDVSGLGELVELEAYRTPIRHLDVSNNPKLEKLLINWTKIEMLDVSNNRELRELVCYETKLKGLDLTGNVKLDTLQAQSTPGLSDYIYINLPAGPSSYVDIPLQSVLEVDTPSKTIDMAVMAPRMKMDRVSNVRGAVLSGSVLTGFKEGNPVTYTYDCGQGKTMDVSVLINTKQRQPKISITRTLNKVYDGLPVTLSETDVDKDGSDGALSIEWYAIREDDRSLLEEAPADAGIYEVAVKMEETDTMLPAATSERVTITKRPNVWVQEPSMPAHTYDGKAPVPSGKAKYGDVEFSYSAFEDGPFTEEPFVDAGRYFMMAEAAQTKNETGLKMIVPYTIGRQVVDHVDTPSAYGRTGQKLSEIALPSGWLWQDPEQYLHAGNERFAAYLPVSAANTDYSNVEGYNEDEQVIVRMVKVKRSILANSWKEEPSISDWTYGEKAPVPSGSAAYGAVRYAYYERDDRSTEIGKPTEAGKYTMVAYVPGTLNYSGLSVSCDFEVRKAVNVWTRMPSISDWTFGDVPSVPAASAKYGDVEFLYGSDDGRFTSNVPVHAGRYLLKAVVTGDRNATSLEGVVPFEIARKKVDVLDTPAVYAVSGTKLKDVPLPSGWSWSDPDQVVHSNNDAHEALYMADSMDHDFSGVDGYDEETDLVTRTIKIGLSAAANEWIDGPSISDWTYGGRVSAPSGTARYGSDTIRYTYYADASLSKRIEKPTEAGSYVMEAVIEGTKDYAGLRSLVPFTIRKADNAWTVSLMQNDFVYNGMAPRPSASAVFGETEFSYSSSADGPFTEDAPVNAGTYFVRAFVPASSNYNALEDVVSFSIERRIVADVPTPMAYGTSGEALRDIFLPDGWQWERGEDVLSSSSLSHMAYVKVDSTNMDFSKVNGFDESSQTIRRLITVQMSKKNNAWVHPLTMADWMYGQRASVPAAVAKHGQVRYVYMDENDVLLSRKPSDAGTYAVVAYVPGTPDHAGIHARQTFTIHKADNEWIEVPSVQDVVYGEVPLVKGLAKYGDVSVSYCSSEDGVFTDDVPVNAGTYFAKVSVPSSANVNGLESGLLRFVIKKRLAEPVGNLHVWAVSGTKLEDIALPSGWSWKDPKQVAHSKNDVHEAVMAADDPNIDYSMLEGYDGAAGVVRCLVKVHLSAKDNEWTSPLVMKDWTYGEAPSMPSASARYGTVRYEYMDDSGRVLDDVPKDAGTYSVAAIVDGSPDHAGLRMSVPFSIGKADNEWIDVPSVADAVYGEGLKLSGSSKYGTVHFEYMDGSGRVLDDVPKDAGSYSFRAVVPGNANVNDLEAKGRFVIRKKRADAIDSPLAYGVSGDRLKDVVLPSCWSWKDPKQVLHSKNNVHDVVMAADDPNSDFSDVDGYDAASRTIVRTIKVGFSALKNEWTSPLEMKGWTVGQMPSVPSAKARYGTVRYEYMDSLGRVLDGVPNVAGTYMVKAIVDGSPDHTGLDASVRFVIMPKTTGVSMDEMKKPVLNGADAVHTAVSAQRAVFRVLTGGSLMTAALAWIGLRRQKKKEEE